jgi:tetratricopeptide (TPR) repeat protein
MLKSKNAFGLGFGGRSAQDEHRLALGMLAIYAALSLFWAFAADAPWDDDCPTRFFNAKSAFRDPENFVSVWNRPLFVLIFALPAQLGKFSIPILMTFISAGGAWLLYKAVRTLNVPNAWLVLPLYCFQPFFFGTSRVALAEPLAAALLCFGFFLLVQRKWMLYALIGGLLPLARLELVPVLLIWAIPLIREKQWKQCVWMAMPFVGWNVAAGLITGDFIYVFHETFGVDKGQNRYGNTGLGHYFERYIYVVGPVVIWFFLIGLVARAKSKTSNLWLEGQFFLGFLIYVLFSWKLSLGNAAGFLRNLVPLTPLVALVAIEGYNHWSNLVFDTKAVGKGKSQILQASKDWRWIGLIALGLVGLIAAFFTHKLTHHQIVSERWDFSRLAVVVVLLGMTAWLWTQRKKAQLSTHVQLWLAGVVVILTGGYTLLTEPPQISNNPERQGLSMIAEYYAGSELRTKPTFANHNWFFWAANLDRDDPSFGRVTQKSLEAAPVGSIVVWDVHYCTRLGGDVMPDYLKAHSEYVELLRIGYADRGEAAVLYQKTTVDPQQQEEVASRFMQQNPKYLPAITARVFQLLWWERYKESMELADYALNNVPNEPDLWFARGFAQLKSGDATGAITSLENSILIVPEFPTAWFNLGMAHIATGNTTRALQAFDHSIAQDPTFDGSFFARGAVKGTLDDFAGASADFSKALSLNPKNLSALSNRAVTYAKMGRVQEALADIRRASDLQPKNKEIWLMRGKIEVQAGQVEAACKSFEAAAIDHNPAAIAMLVKHCGRDSVALQGQ